MRARAESVAARDSSLARLVVRPGLRLSDRVQRDQLGVEAGSLTYGAFLSLPPMLLLAISIVGIVFQQQAESVQRELLDAVGDLVPGFDEVVATQLELTTASQVGSGIVGIVGIVYAASGFVARVRHALGVIFRSRIVGLVAGRLSGAAVGVPVLLVLVAFVAATAWVTEVGLEGALGAPAELVAFAALAVIGSGAWAVVYRLLTPSPGPTIREHLSGAVVFSVGFLALERFGGAYVAGVVSRSTALYGAIGAIFGLLAFIYVAMWLFLLAAVITELRREPRDAPVTRAGA